MADLLTWLRKQAGFLLNAIGALVRMPTGSGNRFMERMKETEENRRAGFAFLLTVLVMLVAIYFVR